MGAKNGGRKTSRAEEKPYASSFGTGLVRQVICCFCPYFIAQIYFLCNSLYLQEHLNNRDLIKASDAQKQKAEEEQRKCFLAVKQKMMKLRKEKETELFR